MVARVPMDLDALRARVDAALLGFLEDRRAALVAVDPRAASPVEQIERMLRAGGRRLRPAFVYWGFRAAGGADAEPIIRAAASAELLHTMAVIHDDLIDDADARRGVPSVHRAVADAAGELGDPAAHGRAVALVTGDLAAVWADELLATSGFPAHVVTAALARSYRMRLEMAAGQIVDLTGGLRDVRRLAVLKGGGYSVSWPLRIGAALASADPRTEDALGAFGDPLGAAFQMLDDLRDGDAASGVDRVRVDGLALEASAALDRCALPEEADAALRDLARLVVAA